MKFFKFDIKYYSNNEQSIKDLKNLILNFLKKCLKKNDFKVNYFQKTKKRNNISVNKSPHVNNKSRDTFKGINFSENLTISGLYDEKYLSFLYKKLLIELYLRKPSGIKVICKNLN